MGQDDLANEINRRIMKFANIKDQAADFYDHWCFVSNHPSYESLVDPSQTRIMNLRPQEFEPKDEYQLSFDQSIINDLHLVPEIFTEIADLVNINKIQTIIIDRQLISRFDKDFLQPIKDSIKEIKIIECVFPEIPSGLFRNLDLRTLELDNCWIGEVARNFGISDSRITNFVFVGNRLKKQRIFDGIIGHVQRRSIRLKGIKINFATISNNKHVYRISNLEIYRAIYPHGSRISQAQQHSAENRIKELSTREKTEERLKKWAKPRPSVTKTQRRPKGKNITTYRVTDVDDEA
ncbi:MAG: hypothetical protein HeimC2_24090 [Candidatus Heimdallarchaeota archaeon LC_2]|nr:MAG: hypothetical protein HeimC2_24090 [Candidatus Heimdallarchaeota archaeon LC_2]